ncbi:MAG TPA: hypothetical protein VHW00_08265 [Thermoanaerobaculia bacterium]|nr:hypothetical protein [Thermoanaerobaculia bacterium]
MIRALLAIAASAWAGSVAVQHGTPIDQALPFLCALVALAGSRDATLLGVPLLILAENVFFEEQTRLLAIGIVMSGVMAITITRSAESGAPASRRLMPERPAPGWRAAGRRVLSRRDAGVPLALILLLRWIPFPQLWLREIALIVIALAIYEVLHRTPFATVVAVLTALATPAIPLRTFALPLAVLFVALLARFFNAPRLRWEWPSAVVIAFVALFFPWSGIMARAFPFFLRPVIEERPRLTLNYALNAGAKTAIDVPGDATALIVSGANVATLRRGARLGRIEPGGIEVRIGDAADWGYMRRDHFYGSHNPLPRDVAGRIRGWGYNAWIDGAGRIALPPGARTITVMGDASLPAGATLQVEAFELR